MFYLDNIIRNVKKINSFIFFLEKKNIIFINLS